MDEDAVEHIEIQATPASRGTIVIDLVGERYRMRKPKLHGLMDTFRKMKGADLEGDSVRAGQRGVEMFSEVEDWMLGLFADGAGERIRQRLADDDDDLDVDHIMQAFQAIVAKVSGRPTKSLSDSSQQQADGGRPSTDGPPPEELTSADSSWTVPATSSGTG